MLQGLAPMAQMVGHIAEMIVQIAQNGGLNGPNFSSRVYDGSR